MHFIKKLAFTMIELIMVIVVLGILAVFIVPKLERDLRQEAGENILSAIRYAQHMALIDDVTDPRKKKWQRKFWRFGIRTCRGDDIFYYVGSDKNMGGNIDNIEAAIDPVNAKMILGATGQSCEDGVNNTASENIFISHKYGIKNTNIFKDCATSSSGARYIGFDYLGRPHLGFSASKVADYRSIMTVDCKLRFEFENAKDLVINIEKETGYVFIVDE